MCCGMYHTCYISTCFCYKQKTAYDMRISYGSADVCSSDLQAGNPPYLSPEVERATSHNVRFRSGAAFDPPLWRSHGEVAARSTDGGAYGATSLPLHHFASRAIPFLIATRPGRSEARSVGKDCVRPCRSRWSPYL